MTLQEKNYEPALMYGAANDSVTPQTITAATAAALAVGANGATNPAFQVDTATASVATGVKITGAATGTAVAVAAIGSGTDEHLTIDAKAAGTIKIGSVSTGLITLGSMVSMKQRVLASSGNTTMTTAMSGSVMLLDSATVDYTLPAVGAGDVGIFFDFLATTTSTNWSVTAGAADLLIGSLTIVSADVPTADIFSPNGSSDLVIACNGTTTGGVAGSYFRMVAVSATRWFVSGILSGSGTATTPFA